MAAQDGHTVIALKSSFLRTQVRILSQQLSPSRHWWEENDESGALPDDVIQDALSEVNRQVRRHNQAVYSSLAMRHVAEQIDKLYWNAGEPDLYVEDDLDADAALDGTLRLGDDLRLDENMSKLPDDWEDEDGQTLHPSETEEYDSSLRRIQQLSAQRQVVTQKLNTYKRLLGLLEPLRDPQQSVQPNLVTRDGELAAELARMRALTARVSGRLRGWEKGLDGNSIDQPGVGGSGGDTDEEPVQDEGKVASLLSKDSISQRKTQ